MSLGDSNKSKYGGVLELTGRFRSVSGELSATEASFDRNGSLGLSGGNGILALALALREQEALRLLGPRHVEEDDEEGSEVEMGTCKPNTIVGGVGFFVSSGV